MLKNNPTPSSLPITQQEREHLKRLVDYSQIQSLPEIWSIVAEKFANVVALNSLMLNLLLFLLIVS